MNRDEILVLAAAIGYRIKALRSELGMSQIELSKGIVSQSLLSQFETGQKIPSNEILYLLSDRLQDSLLQNYADLITKGATFQEVIACNPQAILSGLRALRGRWNESQYQLALTVCTYLYEAKQYQTAEQACSLILSQSPVGEVRAKACFYNGNISLKFGRHDSALRYFHEAELNKSHLTEKDVGNTYYCLAYLYVFKDVHAQALWYARLACDIFKTANDFPRYGRALILLGSIESRISGLLDQARYSLETAYHLLRGLGILTTPDFARLALNLSDVFESQGCMVEAQKWAEHCIQSGREVGDYVAVSAAYLILARTQHRTSQRLEAQESLRQALHYAHESNDPWALSWAYLLAAGLMNSASERLQAAQRAYKIANDHPDLLLQRALAAECIYQLSRHDRKTPSIVFLEESSRAYREVLGRNMSLETSTFYLPLMPISSKIL